MTTKIAISLPDDIVAAIKEAVARGQASSVSAYIAETVAARQTTDTLESLLADMFAETGRPSEDAYARARAELDRADADAEARRP